MKKTHTEQNTTEILYTKEPTKAKRTQKKCKKKKEPEGSNTSDKDFDEYQDEEEIKLEEFDRAPEPEWREVERMENPSWLDLESGPCRTNLSFNSSKSFGIFSPTFYS